MFKKVTDVIFKDYDPEIIAWQRESKEGLLTPLMYIYPQPGDNIKKIKYFAVKDYEGVLFFNKGSLIDVVGGGVYLLEKKARIKGTEIVWIDISILDIVWDLPRTSGIFTNEGFEIGLEGDLKLRINDVKTFYNDIVSGRKMWIVQDLKNWLMSLLLTSLRDIIKSYSLEQVKLEDRERLINKIITKVADEFESYGLSLESFNLKNIEQPNNYINLKSKKSISLKESQKDDFDNLINKKMDIKKRIKELEDNIKNIENDLLNDVITKDKFNEKIQQIRQFIKEAEVELEKINDKLSKS